MVPAFVVCIAMRIFPDYKRDLSLPTAMRALVTDQISGLASISSSTVTAPITAIAVTKREYSGSAEAIWRNLGMAAPRRTSALLGCPAENTGRQTSSSAADRVVGSAGKHAASLRHDHLRG